MSKEYRFQLPITEEQAREVKVGDVVYISGVIYTMRDMGHRRAVTMLENGEKLPFDLGAGALWHCGPIVRQKEDGKWETVSAGSTTSSRFTDLGAEVIKYTKLRCTIGKGTMHKKAHDAMAEVGSFYLNSTGGAASLYAGQIEEVVDVHWTDLGLPEAIWCLKVKDLGPLIVGIDSHGESIFNVIGKKMQENLKEIYKNSNLPEDHSWAYLPKRVPSKAKV
ncbi:FumA C-terminus/TtdB family hydratase beta subunit [Selenomonadales bacterium OttesenSCG-928-I06]|nr:FumA C-terminus/TtdB family hydratase beta subunit [Selenomonadales bacterium OttesenSCG-928-I06]